jgi:hypothetical protein
MCKCDGPCRAGSCPCVLAGRACTPVCVCREDDASKPCATNTWSILGARGITFDSLPLCTSQALSLEERHDLASIVFLLDGGERAKLEASCDNCMFSERVSFEEVANGEVECECGLPAEWSLCDYTYMGARLSEVHRP